MHYFRQTSLDLGFVVFDTLQQDESVILKKVMLHNGLDTVHYEGPDTRDVVHDPVIKQL